MINLKQLVLGNEKQIYSIHYSSNGFYSGSAIAPSICCISLVNMDSREVQSFDIDKYLKEGKCLIDSEKQLLTDFVNFYKSLDKPTFVTWNMTGIAYGFSAIYSRCENFGIEGLNFSWLETIDISEYFEYSLQTTLIKNCCCSQMFLTGKEEVDCFKKRAYNLVKQSTESKAIGLIRLLTKLINNSANRGYDYPHTIYADI